MPHGPVTRGIRRGQRKGVAAMTKRIWNLTFLLVVMEGTGKLGGDTDQVSQCQSLMPHTPDTHLYSISLHTPLHTRIHHTHTHNPIAHYYTQSLQHTTIPPHTYSYTTTLHRDSTSLHTHLFIYTPTAHPYIIHMLTPIYMPCCISLHNPYITSLSYTPTALSYIHPTAYP